MQHYLSIGAIFKNEANHLQEWIEFHRLMGVEHFYLVDNESEDDFQSVLWPYIRSNVVTLSHWNGRGQQLQVYGYLIKQLAARTFWLCANRH